MDNYKLRTSIPGHEKDVRCIRALTKECSLLSGSRDVTVRCWKPTGREFVQKLLLDGHSNYISSVESAFPYHGIENGVIFTGSNDSTIRAHDGESGKYLFTLRGHGETVCSLRYNEAAGLLVSGSWDKTARLWKDDQCISTLAGHEAAVWAAVFVTQGDGVITGSADKTIRLWRPLSFNQAKWTCQQRYVGHSDCVRDLAILPNDRFLSCSNDASIRLWKLTGECVQEFYGHTNFIYGLDVLPSGEEFVSCSEDRSVRVWSVATGQSVQSIAMPCQSVWCVTVLTNGDIAVGGNDAMIRVFTRHSELEAPETEKEIFTDQVSSTAIPGQLGDIKMTEVPGPEILTRPGRSEGFVTMVRRGATVECYQWSQGQWSKIGDVVGTSGATQQTSGKQLHEGREYDYVFSIDVVEGAPPLKLPYNITEDPYLAAQSFIHRHNLPQEYLDQVADFITKQVQGVTLQQTAGGGSTYMDPFTGTSRYVPGSGTEPGAGSGSDPLTGGGRYIPPSSNVGATASYMDTPAPSDLSSSYFPIKSVLTFDNVNMEALLKKLKDFNASASQPLSENQLEDIPKLCNRDGRVDTKGLDTIMNAAVTWESNKKFPLLDILRLAVRNEEVNKVAFRTPVFLQSVLAIITDESASDVNSMLVYRIISNACLQPEGQKQILSSAPDLLEHMKKKMSAVANSTNNNLQVAFVTVLLNMVVLLGQGDKPDLLLSEFLMVLGSQLLSYSRMSSSEATFRILVSMGTLVSQLKGNDRRTTVLSSDLPAVVSRHCNSNEKVGMVARDLKLLLSRS